MTTIEEQIWSYIDGDTDAETRQEIAAKIENDENYRKVYQELISFHRQLGGMELDEPSMSFSRNLLEVLQQEAAPVTLQTRVNHHFIYVIGGLFVLAALSILIYSFSQIHLDTQAEPLHLSADSRILAGPLAIKLFFFADMIIAMLYLDSLIRRKKA